ncbi:MAG: M48 family metallopeptidase [Bdellovibrionota bacterium]|nr:M48 family metallopeptidase [Bdellovibrionota bacterium]
MKFTGIYFDQEDEPKKSPAEIEFTAQQLKISIKNKSQPLVWDQAKLTSYCGGSNNHLYFFHRSEFKNPSFYIERSKELDQFLLKSSNLDLQKTVKKRNNKSKLNWTALALVVSIVLASFYFLFSLKDHAVDLIVDQIPYKMERQLGDTLFKNLKSQFEFVEDENLLKRYRAIAQSSLEKNAPPFNKIKLYIVKGEQTNAFAMPGGHIVFFEGALKEFKNYSEFVGVLQHELSHVRLRHSLKNILSSVSTYLLVSVFLGDASGLLAVLADQGSFLLRQSYSREYELEADNSAFDVLIENNIDPRGMVGFFKTLLEKSDSKIEENLEWISTHPATQKRIDNILSRYKNEVDDNLKAKLIINHAKFNKWKNEYYSKEKEAE